jgi:hypothetical protein
MTHRRFSFTIIRSNGRERKAGSSIIAWGFDHGSRAQVENHHMITRFVLLASVVLAALARIDTRGCPESLT